MNLKPKIAFSWSLLCIICMVVLMGSSVFAQKVDTAKISYKPKPKVVSRVPQIKANITPYKVGNMGLGSMSNQSTLNTPLKSGKIITVLKVYPNPVSEQINISIKLERETTFVVKITDMLGNDVVTLANERSPAGEQTKTYTIPNRLNTGIYFLKIVAGGEPVVKRISVL
jgi:Secretion system C-terminal sorting domain